MTTVNLRLGSPHIRNKKLELLEKFEFNAQSIGTPAQHQHRMVFVRGLNGCIWSANCGSDTTIADLMDLIHQHDGIPVDMQRLVVGGLTLQPTMAASVFHPDTNVTVMLRVLGGAKGNTNAPGEYFNHDQML
jgi:hypothetical protein